ncbi:MAG: hypothetical protein WB762_29525 [Candidatus Sulfotelmatobacter sp.]
MATKPRLIGVVPFLLAAILGLGAGLDPAPEDPFFSRIVASFNAVDEPAVPAILRFGRELSIPLGIVLDKQLSSASFKEIRIEHAPVKVALDQLSSALPSYRWSLEHGTVVFAPLDAPAATARFLSWAVSAYGVPEDTLDAQTAYEWLNIRASLRPSEGTAFSVLSSAKSRKWPPLSLGPATVEEVLDRLVGRNPGGAWILCPINDIEKAAESRPFQLIDYSTPGVVALPCPDQLGNASYSTIRP